MIVWAIFAVLCASTAPASAEPISGIIGLTALINTAITGAVGFGAVGTVLGVSAGAIGGFIVSSRLTRGISMRKRR